MNANVDFIAQLLPPTRSYYSELHSPGQIQPTPARFIRLVLISRAVSTLIPSLFASLNTQGMDDMLCNKNNRFLVCNKTREYIEPVGSGDFSNSFRQWLHLWRQWYRKENFLDDVTLCWRNLLSFVVLSLLYWMCWYRCCVDSRWTVPGT